MSDLTVEPSWRENVPEMVDPYVHSDTSLIQQLVDRGSLIPDLRLQAIADAWNNPTLGFQREIIRVHAPELATAIEDALNKENNG